jgi:serine/threonine protein kinase
MTTSSNYLRGSLLGVGEYGEVFEAFRKTDNMKVAVKRIKPDTKGGFFGIHFTALREIKSMKELDHCNVMKVSFPLLLSSPNLAQRLSTTTGSTFSFRIVLLHLNIFSY